MINLFGFHGRIRADFALSLLQEVRRPIREEVVFVQNRLGQVAQISGRLMVAVAFYRLVVFAVVVNGLLLRKARLIALAFAFVHHSERRLLVAQTDVDFIVKSLHRCDKGPRSAFLLRIRDLFLPDIVFKREPHLRLYVFRQPSLAKTVLLVQMVGVFAQVFGQR